MPDLRGALTGARPYWQRFVDLVATGAGAVEVLVVHSGAGAMAPLLAELLQPSAVIFVDAIVPGDGPEHRASTAFVEFVDRLPHDGPLLPPWHEWWADDDLADLVPDPELRRLVTDDIPRVPRSFYDEPVPLPDGWAGRHGCRYAQLSPAYELDRARAAAFGWPMAAMVGQHLDTATRPADVADLLLALLLAE